MSNPELQDFSPTDLCAKCPMRRGIDNESITSVSQAVGCAAEYGDTVLISVSFSNGRKQSEHFVIGGIEGGSATDEEIKARSENAKRLANECHGPTILGRALARLGMNVCDADFVKLKF